jgi:hypothetical protein
MSGHQSQRAKKDEWLTPPSILEALGPFDLDPCAPIKRPWPTAKNHFTIIDNGLKKEWAGRVWCNPPYGKEAEKWLRKLADHGNGIALIFARTETRFFFSQVWERADAVFFIKGRLYFHHVSGKVAKNSGGAPSCLVAYGKENSRALKNANIKGKHIELNSNSILERQTKLNFENAKRN